MSQTIYFNGDIITMEDHLPAEAVLVSDGVIALVGSKEQVFACADPDAKLFDLQGKALLPGFIDSHSHVTALASSLGLVPLKDAISFEDIQRRMVQFIQQNPVAHGQWIMGFGYDHNALQEKAHPNKNLLDGISTEYPVLIAHASGHMGVTNSLGLRLLGIGEETEDPEGGKIGREAGSKQPNGYLEETAFTGSTVKIPGPSPEQMIEQLAKAQEVYLSYGITTVQDGFTKSKEWQMLSACAQKGKLLLDVVSFLDLQGSSQLAEEEHSYWKQYQNHLKIGGYKIFLDGSPQGRTAWMLQPYVGGEPGYKGYPVHTDAQVKAFIEKALQDGAQLLAHCNGDGAAQQYISCWEQVLEEQRILATNRPVMIHAQLVRKEQLHAMAKLHMLASFFTAHTYYWGDVHIQNFGRERASQISPAVSAIEEGVAYTFHQDTPVIMPNMLETLWCATNRKTKSGITLGEDQQISVYDALKGITINGAYQYFEEDTKGSIKQGKLADFVVLSHNPLAVPKEQLREIWVEATIKEDTLVFQK